MKKRAVVVLLACMLSAVSLTGCGEIKDSDVAVTIDGKEITADIANFLARYTQAQYETYYAGYLGEDMWSGEGSEEGTSYEDTVKDTVRESLENMYLMEAHMKDYDISLTDEEKNAVKAAAEQFDESNSLGEKDKVSGSRETVERVLELMTIQQKVKTAIEAEVDTEVSDEEAAQKKMEYVMFSFTSTDEEGNTSDLSDEEKQELKESAEKFAAGAKEAESFSDYAKEQGYEATEATFDAESIALPAQLVEAADALDEGGTTGLVEGDSGYYVARVVSLLDREATDTKKDEIISERKQTLLNDTLDEWREHADIKVHKSIWNKIDFQDLRVTMKQEEEEPYSSEVQTDDQVQEEQE